MGLASFLKNVTNQGKKDIDQTDLHLSKDGNSHLKGGWGISGH